MLTGAWIYARRPPRASSAPANAYVDAAVCAECHGGIAATYRKTGMGRSFSRAQPESAPPFGKPFHHEASNSYFEMISRGGKYYQRRWQIGFDGKETNIDEKQVDFVIGSGNHAKTYLHLTAQGALQVLPLSWYSEKGGYWDMSPGYDQPDYPGSVRPVHYECMFCHNAYPKIPESMQHSASAEMTFVQPIPEGIDCQRCHGPGKRHVDMAYAGGPVEQIRAAIVNPKRLPPDREIEVCMQCHLETTSLDLPHSIRRYDRSPFSYVPGEPLGDFSLAFDRASGMNDRFEIAQGAYRLRESQCFLKSQGKLRCTTCHNPHDIPHGPEAAAHYNAVCQSCHAGTLRQTSAGSVHATGADCISCHMPKRRTDDVVRVVMTDHLIQRRKPEGDPLAPKPEVVESVANKYRGEVVAYYPAQTAKDSLYLAAAQIRNQTNLAAGLTRMASLVDKQHPADAAYYAELAQGYRAGGDFSRAIPMFEEAARREPTGYRLVQLGNAQMEARQWTPAEASLRRAIQLEPDDASAWGTLGWVLWQQDKGAEARSDLEKAVMLDPDLPEMHNNLASVLWGTGDQAGAEKEFREALRIQPGIAEWRLNLGRVLASRGQLPEARYQFEQAVKLKPDLAEARLEYGHLLEDRGDSAGAIRELEAAVRLQKDLWRAHFELAMALGRRGDTTGALEHLRIAANGSDPDARAAALQVLQRLGQ
ncbi:MAG TPA: tetratricopeptide repeat protein [Bryobacteraceae bacterium]